MEFSVKFVDIFDIDMSFIFTQFTYYHLTVMLLSGNDSKLILAVVLTAFGVIVIILSATLGAACFSRRRVRRKRFVLSRKSSFVSL